MHAGYASIMESASGILRAVEQLASVFGNLAEWVTALVAMAALGAAGLSAYYARQAAKVSSNAYLSDVKVRREAQAKQVLVTVEHRYSVSLGNAIHYGGRTLSGGNASSREKDMGGYSAMIADEDLLDILVRIRNMSSEVVGPYELSAYDADTGASYGFSVGDDSAPILPGGELFVGLMFRRPVSGHPMPSIKFRDSSGSWWRRRHFEPIEYLGGTPD